VSNAAKPHLFELFYRDPDRAKSVSGSGIGLFVCASLVEAMGGRIWVEDTPGGGARFSFSLRIAETEEQLHRAKGPDLEGAIAGRG
jgi:signal transduction histidine kinase